MRSNSSDRSDSDVRIVRDTFAISVDELRNPGNLSLESSNILPNGLDVSIQANFSEIFDSSASSQSPEFSFSAFANDGLYLARNNPFVTTSVVDFSIRNKEVSNLSEPILLRFSSVSSAIMIL